MFIEPVHRAVGDHGCNNRIATFAIAMKDMRERCDHLQKLWDDYNPKLMTMLDNIIADHGIANLDAPNRQPPGQTDLVQGPQVKLTIMRGAPGSGKSTSALAQAKVTGAAVISTDDYFMAGEGDRERYLFDPSEIGLAHAWNQRRCKKLLAQGLDVIVDNTNTHLWEMREYVAMGVERGYEIEIVQPTTQWKFNAEECARRNTHRVPLQAIQGMMDRFENLPSNCIIGGTADDIAAIMASQSPFKKRA